tara:strand:- start:549 stop:908 length:360 start_codon:yes stop_codon:yes gene_type:complete
MSQLRHAINLQKRQLSRLTDLKKVILNKLSEKINILSKNGQLKFIYNTPIYMFGYAKYDIEELTFFILNTLSSEGYCAVKLTSSSIFISWDINDINILKKEKKKRVKQFESLMPIINMK